MKKSILHIVSYLLLFAFIFLLVVSSTTILNLDEENEASTELSLEDFFDDEVLVESQSFLSNWILTQSIQIDLNDILKISTVYLMGKYSLIERSILVPPPDFKA